MMLTVRYCLLVLGFVIWFSIAIPIDRKDRSSSFLFSIPYDQQLIEKNYIAPIKNEFISHQLNKSEFKEKLRQKRDSTDNTDIKAIVATVNDHRTMIDDHRTMINNIINNSINTNNLQTVVSNHYSKTTPIWTSWRDIVLIFLLSKAIIEIFYCCICHVKFKPWDYLVSLIFERHQIRQSAKERKVSRRSIHNNTLNMEHINKSKERTMYPNPHLSTIEEDYAFIHNNEAVPESAKRI